MAIIANEKTILQYIGKIDFVNHSKSVYFNNVAGIGFDAHVVNSVNKFKRFGSLSYILGSIAGFSTFNPVPLKIEIDEKEIITYSLMTMIGIGKYSGGGMQLTQTPNLTDGLFDVTIAKNITIRTILVNIFKLYSGKLVYHKEVENYKTNKIRISIIDKHKPFIEADGEIINTSNFEVKILPKVIQFVVP